MKQQCSEIVYRAGEFMSDGESYCARNGVLQEEGKWWCKRHVPSSVAARNKASNAKWNAKRKEREAADNICAAESKVVEAAVGWRVHYEPLACLEVAVDTLMEAREAGR